jgi:hypothetical protein
VVPNQEGRRRIYGALHEPVSSSAGAIETTMGQTVDSSTRALQGDVPILWCIARNEIIGGL